MTLDEAADNPSCVLLPNQTLNQRIQNEKDRHQQEIIALQDNYQDRSQEYKSEIESLKEKIELVNAELSKKNEEIQSLQTQVAIEQAKMTASGEEQTSDKPPAGMVVSQEELAVPMSTLRIDASPNNSNKSDDGWCLNGIASWLISQAFIIDSY